jgi:molybdopterin synthase sulfur carrier subunit
MSSSASIPLLSTRSAVGSLIGRLAGEVEPSGAPGSARREAWYSSGMTTSTDTITARLFAGLETQTAERRTQHTFLLTETPNVGSVVERLGLEPGATGIVLVNGVHAGGDRVLEPGDEISLFPPLGGG